MVVYNTSCINCTLESVLNVTNQYFPQQQIFIFLNYLFIYF